MTDQASTEDVKQEVPPERTEVRYSKEEVEEINEIIAKICKSPDDGGDKPVVGAMITLLAARQIYMSALVDLQARLQELEVQHADGVRQMIVDRIAGRAGHEQFTRTGLVNKIQKHVLPWLMAVIQSDNAKEAARNAEREKTLDEERRARAVPIGFPTEKDLPEDPKLLGRDRSLVLAGHPGAVKYLVRKAGQTALLEPERPNVPKLRVLHLSCYDPINRTVKLKGQKGELHLTIGLDQWKEKGTNRNNLHKFLLPWCKRMRRVGIDLLLVDDLSLLTTPAIKGLSPLRVAAEAQRHLRKWADDAGCAVVAGLPLEESPELPELNEDWNQLEVYTTLRRLRLQGDTEDDDDNNKFYKVFLDNGALAVDLVAREVIDNYKDDQDEDT